MIWRRIGNPFGTSPPPVRALYAGGNPGLLVWTRSRVLNYFNGHLTVDSGWTDWAAELTWPAGGSAQNTTGSVSRNDVMIETAGRVMPWQIVIRDRLEVVATGVTTFSDYTTDMVPGTVATFSYDASAGQKRTADQHYYNIPAEGL